MRFFDTHAHLNDARFDEDREALIESLPSKDIHLVMNVACDMQEAPKVKALSEKYDFIYAAVGMHPHVAGETSLSDLDAIARYMEHEKFLALGEIGLDYYYDFSPREVQQKWFDAQLSLAKQLDVPVILHIRDAFGDCLDILKAHKDGLRGVMHCYSGSYEFAKLCLDMGLYIAFGGAVTFKNAVKPAEVAAKIPLERLLLETDCPYMTPVPLRGKRNDPSLMRYTAEKIAALRNMEVEELAEITFQNGKQVFGIL